MDEVQLAVQIRSPHDVHMSFSRQERQSIASSTSASGDVYWLPGIAKNRDKNEDGFEINSTTIVFALGVGFGSLAKPFFDSIAKEAGKDFWELVKNLISSIWCKQSEKAYSMSGKAYIFFELKDEHVGVRLELKSDRNSGVDLDEAREIIKGELNSLADFWEDINETIENHNVGKKGRASMNDEKKTQVHIVRQNNKGEWFIHARDAPEFFADLGGPGPGYFRW